MSDLLVRDLPTGRNGHAKPAPERLVRERPKKDLNLTALIAVMAAVSIFSLVTLPVLAELENSVKAYLAASAGQWFGTPAGVVPEAGAGAESDGRDITP